MVADPFSLVDYQSYNAGEECQQNGTDSVFPCGNEHSDEYAGADVKLLRRILQRTEILSVHQCERSRCDESDDGGTEYGKNVCHSLLLAVLQKKTADDNHQYERGQYDSKSGNQAAEQAKNRRISGFGDRRESYVCGCIDADGTRGHLTDGHNVGKFTGG